MRVAVANWTSRHAGGIETYVGHVSGALAEHGHDVFFIHERDAPEDRPEISGVRRFPTASIERSGLNAALNALSAWKPDVVFVQRLTDVTHERQLLAMAPAVLFAHDYLGLCISGSRTHRARQDRVCHEQFDARCLARFFPYRCGGRSPVTMWRDYRRQAATLERLREYRDVACFSEHMRELYLRQGFANDRVHRLPPIEFPPASHVARPDRASSGYQLLFMGRIDRLKGCHVLIDALPILTGRLEENVTLLVAGGGPDEEACRRVAERAMTTSARVQIRFLGWQSPERCEALLRETDALIMPSLWPEPLGLAGLEALRAGVPVSAFAVGAIPEWLEDGVTGTLAPADPPSAASLSDAIARCLESADIRAAVQTRARSEVSAADHVSQLTGILESAAGMRSGLGD